MNIIRSRFEKKDTGTFLTPYGGFKCFSNVEQNSEEIDIIRKRCE